MVELVTRLILNCKGSAFQKLQIHQAELLKPTEDDKSVKRLVELLGGQWGRIALEHQYEDAEAALFNTIQKPDESHDSYLARTDIMWSRLLSRRMTLEELQAYMTLRGSLLTTEEKKRVILDCDQSSSGKLSTTKVSDAIRLLGASFFQELTGAKKSAKTKVYEAANLAAEEEEEATENALAAQGDWSEEDWMEHLLAEGDDDASLIADFEDALADSVQDDQTLATAYSAYQDARRRLSEKARYRGFWPTSKGSNQHSSKGKGSGYPKGTSKGKTGGQNPAFGQRSRKSLQERIMNSNCRICNRRGHWRAECPFRNQSPSDRVSQTNASSSAAPTSTVVAEPVNVSEDPLPMEFVQLPVLAENTVDEEPPRIHKVCCVNTSFVHLGKPGYSRLWGEYNDRGYSGDSAQEPCMSARHRLSIRMHRIESAKHRPLAFVNC